MCNAGVCSTISAWGCKKDSYFNWIFWVERIIQCAEPFAVFIFKAIQVFDRLIQSSTPLGFVDHLKGRFVSFVVFVSWIQEIEKAIYCADKSYCSFWILKTSVPFISKDNVMFSLFDVNGKYCPAQSDVIWRSRPMRISVILYKARWQNYPGSNAQYCPRENQSEWRTGGWPS